LGGNPRVGSSPTFGRIKQITAYSEANLREQAVKITIKII
jgi:hypothetical protein